MAGFQEKRKPFKGKKFHKDLREFKNQEIKRSLTHRARLRKNYFKILEQEGEAPVVTRDEQKSSEESGEDEEEDGEEREGAEEKPKRTPLPAQKPPPRRSIPEQRAPPNRKPLNFAERAKLAKERKEQKRDEQLERVQERRRKLEQDRQAREQKKLSLSKRTRKGQPVMGPKINDLLDKIRSNQ